METTCEVSYSIGKTGVPQLDADINDFAQFLTSSVLEIHLTDLELIKDYEVPIKSDYN